MRTRLVGIGLAALLAGAWSLHARLINAAPAARPAAANVKIDRIFAEWDRRDSPGCAVAVYQGGRIAYERGYGMADLEHDVPITPESVFYVGSLSKQFTAMAAALAIEQGKLAIDDPIRKYLPELPEYTSSITIRHLLHHTSGLPDYNTLLTIAGRRGDEAFDNLTVLRITARQKKLNFQPGDEYLYSNTGYTLLALIVERATGTPFAEFATKNIFAPLGMTVTHYHTDETRLVKWRALAYAVRASDFRLDTPSNERSGAGGVFTSVRDLVHWDENFYSPGVGGRSVIDRLQTPGALNGGKPLAYAWGLQIGAYRGLRVVEHGGALGGYRAHLLRFPDRHTSVAVLCNLGSIDSSALARRVADAALGSHFTAPVDTSRRESSPPARRPSGSPATGPSEQNGASPLSAYAGRYYSDEVEATFIVDTKNGQLRARRDNGESAIPLEAGDGESFRFRGMTIRFERAADGTATALLVDAGRVRDIRFVRRADADR